MKLNPICLARLCALLCASASIGQTFAADTLVDSWKIDTKIDLSSADYSQSGTRGHLSSYGILIDSQYLERFGVVIGGARSTLGYVDGTNDLQQQSGFASARMMLTPDGVPGQIGLRIDGHIISNTDVSNETDNVRVINPRLSYMAFKKDLYLDLGYARSLYGESNFGNGNLIVTQWTPTVGFGFNRGWEWMQLRGYMINYSNAARANGKDSSKALEASWTHYTDNKAYKPAQITLLGMIGSRMYAVDADIATVYNLADTQKGGASLSAQWKFSRDTRWNLAGGANYYSSASKDRYLSTFVYTGFSSKW